MLVPFFVYNLVDRYQPLNPDRTHPDGMVALGLNNESLRMAAYWAMWMALVYTMLLIWLDRFCPQRPFIWFLSLGWGACTAAQTSIYTNSWAGQMMQTISADADSGTQPAIFIAPLVEKATKAIVLFLLVVFYRNRFVSRINVVSLVGLSAIGFTFAENTIYYARVIVFATNHIEVGDPEQAVLKLVMLRDVYASFGHPTLTMMTALGIAAALGAYSKWVRVMAPLAGFLLAVGGHMFFSGVSSLSSVDNPRDQWYMALGLVAAMVLFLMAGVVGETRVLQHRFIDLRQGGWLNDQDVIVYSSPFRRIKLHLAGICRGPKVWWRTAKFMRLITEPAHTREQTIRGTVGPGFDNRTHKPVHQTEKFRPDVLTDIKGLTIIPRRRPQNGATPYPPFPYQLNS